MSIHKYIVLILTALPAFVFGQDYELNNSTINSGFGAATSSTYQLNGAVGEVIGTASSTNFILNAGSISNRAAATSDPGLIAYYRLNGDLTDDSGNEYDAFSLGSLELHPDVAGLPDRAALFNGSDSYVGYDFAVGQLFTGVTLSAWVNLANPGSTNIQNIISLESDSHIVQMAVNNGSFELYYEDIDGFERWTFGTPSVGWHHVVVTWDGTTVNSFVDGLELGPVNNVLSLFADIGTISIGSTPLLGEYLEGALDEIRIYDYGLTADEVEDLYNSYPPPPTAPQNLQAWILGPGTVELNWDDVPNETYYQIIWDQDGSNVGNEIINADENSYLITGLEPGLEHLFEVGAGNDFGGYTFSQVTATPRDLGPPAAFTLIEPFTLDETILLQYSPDLSYPENMMDTATQVFLHVGALTKQNLGTTNFDGFLKAEMTFNGGVYEFTINPRTDLGLSSSFKAASLGIFVTNSDSSAFGFSDDLTLIELDVFDPVNVGPIGGFVATEASTDIFLDDANAFTPANIQIEDLSEFTIEALVSFDDTDPATFTNIVSRGLDNTTYIPLHGIIAFSADGIPAYPTTINSTGLSPLIQNINSQSGIDVDGQLTNYQTGTWAHIALVYTTPSSGNMDLYVNGIFQESLLVTGSLSAADILRIGNYSGGIDELRFWSDARNQDEIRSNLNSEIDPASEDLIGYWKMNAIENGFILDETASLNDLIVNNATINQLPDLTFSSLALNPGSIGQEENLNISYTVENIGEADATGFSLDFYLSSDETFDVGDIFLETVDFGGLSPSQSEFDVIQATIPDATNAPSGDYFVIGVIDEIAEVEEEIEVNNTLTRPLEIGTPNTLPTNISVSPNSFVENLPIGSQVGFVQFFDPDDDLYDYTLVAGSGDTDNALFDLNGSQLITNSDFNFETDKTTYSIRVQVDDRRGTGTPSAAISLTLTDVNEEPTAINLDGTDLVEGTYTGGNAFVIGNLTTDDEDMGDIHFYQVTAGGTISTGGSSGSIRAAGGQLVADGVINLSDLTNVQITVSSTDDGGSGFTITQDFTINIVPAGIAPSALLLTNRVINANQGAEAVIGQFFAVDDDSNTFTYALVGGANQSDFAVSSAGVLTQSNENLSPGTYSIQVSASDDTNLSITRTFDIIVIDDAVSNVISIGGEQSNYRIIGVPFTNATIGNTFPDLTNETNLTEWRMFGYANGSTSELKTTSSQLRNGNGYWFISTIQQSVELPAGSVTTSPTVGKALSQGYNLIGNPFLTTLDWNTVLNYNENTTGSISAGDVDDEIYVWNGSWNRTSTLGVMQGGFVNVNVSSSSFEFPSASASLGSRTIARGGTESYFNNSEGWQLYLNLESNGLSSNIAGVGLNSLSIDEYDRFDIAPPPTPAIFDPLQLTEKSTGLTKNIKEVNPSVFWDFALTGSEGAAKISWDQEVVDMLEEPLMLALLPQGNLYDMREVGEITFNPDNGQSVMVIYGEELPKELLINAITAYPNPADQEVNFRFFVDEQGIVPAAVELYNLSGKQLGSIQQNATGGQWNEINYRVGTQDLLKSGIYLFKVRYAGFESKMKKLIVK